MAKADARRFVAWPRTLAVLDAVIDGSNPQEPVQGYFPGDDLFTPFERARGLPLGNLTSQWPGNGVMNPLDHWVNQAGPGTPWAPCRLGAFGCGGGGCFLPTQGRCATRSCGCRASRQSS